MALLSMERAGLPALLLSARGELLLIAPAAAQMLGWQYERRGGDWFDSCVLAASVPSARRLVARALTGTLPTFELEVLTGSGPALVRFDANAVGTGDEAGLLLLIRQCTPLARYESAADYDYEVQGAESGQWRLTRMWRHGGEMVRGAGTCHEALYGRSTPCESCPIRQRKTGSFLVVAVQAAPPHDYVLATAKLSGNDGVRVSVRRLSMASLSAVLQARIDELAGRACLSGRERSVLTQLVGGRAHEEIAAELAISPRTVRFHQSNLLQKLGAESRSDLLRLVF